MEEKFKAFLKENDALEKYNTNCGKADELDPSGSVEWHSGNLSDTYPIDFLTEAFYWDPTEEGEDYWSELSIEWQDTLEA